MDRSKKTGNRSGCGDGQRIVDNSARFSFICFAVMIVPPFGNFRTQSVHSVLFLILAFFNRAVFYPARGEFLRYPRVVYVGAVRRFFLVMMLMSTSPN